MRWLGVSAGVCVVGLCACGDAFTAADDGSEVASATSAASSSGSSGNASGTSSSSAAAGTTSNATSSANSTVSTGGGMSAGNGGAGTGGSGGAGTGGSGGAGGAGCLTCEAALTAPPPVAPAELCQDDDERTDYLKLRTCVCPQNLVNACTPSCTTYCNDAAQLAPTCLDCLQTQMFCQTEYTICAGT